MADATTAVLPESHPPDWSTIDADVVCPLCEYNLRGLIEPRCPECGYAFTWPALLESRQNIHPYLFEHHPKRNLRAFFRTLIAGLLPRRFWRTLTPLHPVRPGRLVLYGLLTSLPFLLPILIAAGMQVWVWHIEQSSARVRFVQLLTSPPSPAFSEIARKALAEHGSAQAAAKAAYPTSPVMYGRWLWHEYRMPGVALISFMTWPYLMTGILLVYRRSMRQARIRPAQVFRCAVYSADIGALAGILCLAILLFRESDALLRGIRPAWGRGNPSPGSVLILIWHLVMMVAIYRLTIAYSTYLRFSLAWIAVPLAAVAVALVDWILILNLAVAW